METCQCYCYYRGVNFSLKFTKTRLAGVAGGAKALAKPIAALLQWRALRVNGGRDGKGKGAGREGKESHGNWGGNGR